MGKRKCDPEMAKAMDDPYFPHLMPEHQLTKKQQLPTPPKIRPRTFIDMKLSWDEHPEIVVRVMLDCGANVPVISQEMVQKHEIPGVPRQQACGFSAFDGIESGNTGRAYTPPCTQRVEGHYSRETFEICTRQDDHDVLLPW